MVNITMTQEITQSKSELPMPKCRTVVMVHGMWSRPLVWDNFRHHLEARGFRVITPTLRHHDVAPGEMPDPALATTSLLDYAADLEREIRLLDEMPYIIGHSMGGTLAQMLAARGLARGAVLLATAHCAPIFGLTPSVLRFFMRELLLTPFWRRTQIPSFRAMRRSCLNGFSERDAHNVYSTLIPESGLAAFELALWFFDKRRAALIDAEQVTCPMLILSGTDDRLTPLSIVRRTAAYYGDKAKLEVLPGRSHWLPMEPGWEEIAQRATHFMDVEAPLIEIKTGTKNPVPAFNPQLA